MLLPLRAAFTDPSRTEEVAEEDEEGGEEVRPPPAARPLDADGDDDEVRATGARPALKEEEEVVVVKEEEEDDDDEDDADAADAPPTAAHAPTLESHRADALTHTGRMAKTRNSAGSQSENPKKRPKRPPKASPAREGDAAADDRPAPTPPGAAADGNAGSSGAGAQGAGRGRPMYTDEYVAIINSDPARVQPILNDAKLVLTEDMAPGAFKGARDDFTKKTAHLPPERVAAHIINCVPKGQTSAIKATSETPLDDLWEIVETALATPAARLKAEGEALALAQGPDETAGEFYARYKAALDNAGLAHDDRQSIANFIYSLTPRGDMPQHGRLIHAVLAAKGPVTLADVAAALNGRDFIRGTAPPLSVADVLKTCHECGVAGHIAKDCPARASRYASRDDGWTQGRGRGPPRGRGGATTTATRRRSTATTAGNRPATRRLSRTATATRRRSGCRRRPRRLLASLSALT
jgi:hypothetical protein